jgi:hypothetical protein
MSAIPYCLLALLVGLAVGRYAGAELEGSAIVDDCKYGGSFTVKHSGFQCRAL